MSRSITERPRTDRQRIPLIIICLAVAVFLLIALRIVGYGYLPIDDALQHAAQAVSGKDLHQVLILRDEVKTDPHGGWHALLGFVHRLTGWDQDGLVVFSVAALFLIFCLIPCFFLERPEAWVAAVLAASLLEFGIVRRLFYGRPYIVTMSVLLLSICLWPRLREKRFPYTTVAILAALTAISVWIHCVWYLLIVPIVSLLLAREWRVAGRFSIAVLCGVILGGVLSGQPYVFLKQSIVHACLTLNSNVPRRLLVIELQPFTGAAMMLMFVGGLLMWRSLRGAWNKQCIDNPVFILAGIGWALGFVVVRFWLDWAAPALLVWIALEFQDLMKSAVGALSWRRVLITVAISSVLFLAVTHDSESRWTRALTLGYLSQDDPRQAPWLPEPGGIIYSDDDAVFFETFFKNPTAPWRYILGPEQAWLPPEDYKILHNIRWNFGIGQAFEPWVKKMRPQDRLVIRGVIQSPPNIPELEWCYAAAGTWVGKLPANRQKVSSCPKPRT